MSSEKEFVTHLFEIAPPDQFVEIRRISARGKVRSISAYMPAPAFASNFSDVLARVLAYNKTGHNIYFGTCPRKIERGGKKAGRDADIEFAIALWADTDDGKHARTFVDAAIRTLAKENLEPSIVVETGHGRHFYWLLDKPVPVEEARRAMTGLHDYLQGDNVYNASRIMRLPGTMNVKDPDNPKPCFVSSATWKRYSIEAFKEIAHDPGDIGGDVDDEPADSAEQVNREAPKDIKEILQGVGKGERNNAATKLAGHYFGKRLSSDEVFDAMVQWNSRNKPPMEEKELRTVVRSIGEREKQRQEKKKKKKRDRGSAECYFDGKEFLPFILASEVCAKHKLIATPIGNDGLGIDLYNYDNGVFRKGGTSLVETEARQSLGESAKKTRAFEVIDLIRGMQKVDYRELNPEGRNLVNVKNGMLDWRTGKLIEHDWKYLSTIQVNAEYKPDAASEDLDKFLKEIFPDDALLLVEEFVGYLLIPDTSLQKCFVAVGSGGNGKGTFLKLLANFLGEENVSALSIHEICEDTFAVANLFGKSVNIYHDLEPKLLEKTGKFKAITSGDEIGAQEKYKAYFNFTPFCRLVFSANQFPRTSDRTEAFYDRLIFVPFPNRFRGTDQCILNYEEKLAAIPGVFPALLNRALAGLQRLMKKGRFSIPESSLSVIEDYRRENSSAYDFIREFCTFEDPTAFISKREIYQKYSMWCTDSGLKSMSNKQFSKALQSLNVQEHRTSGSRGWAGIAWVNGAPDTSSDEVDDLEGKLKSDELF